jgi:hypothetical protein
MLQPSDVAYLIDSQHTPDVGLSTSAVASGWSQMYVDGVPTERSMDLIPVGRWVFVHLELAVRLTGNLIFMASARSGDLASPENCLKGRLGDVAVRLYPLPSVDDGARPVYIQAPCPSPAP